MLESAWRLPGGGDRSHSFGLPGTKMATGTALLVLLRSLVLLASASVVWRCSLQRMRRGRAADRLVRGAALGAAAAAAMAGGARDGLIAAVDGRSVILGVAGATGDPLSAAASLGLATAYAVWRGGLEEDLGLAVLLLSTLTGAAFRVLARRTRGFAGAASLWGLGVALHGLVLVAAAAAGGAAWTALRPSAPSLLLLYPLAMALGGQLLAHEQRVVEEEQALRASEARYRSTLLSVGDGVIVTDASGRVELMNPVAEALCGWNQEEARGRPLEEVFHIVNEFSRREVENPVRRVMREGTVVGLANHSLLIARDGTERPIADSGAPVRDATGALTGVILVFRDQTEERAAERRLRESEANLARAQRAARLGSWELDLATGRFLWSAEMYRLTGFDPSRGTPSFAQFLDWVHAEDRSSVAEAETRVVASTGATELEFRGGTGEGGPRHFHARMEPIMDSSGRVVGLAGTLQDITERKRVEAALREAHVQYQQLFDEAPVGYHEYDAEGRITRVNRTELEMLGYEAQEVLGRPVWDFVGEEETSRQAVLAKLAGQSPAGRAFERAYRRKDGSTIPVMIEDRPVRDSEGRIVGFRSTIQDISARKRIEAEKQRLQEQLLQAQKMEAVGRLAGGVAHDFNNMLQVIMAYLELAMSGPTPEQRTLQDLREAYRTAQRAGALVQRLLAFARKQTVSPRVTDLNEAVSGTLAMLGRLLREDIELVWIPAEGLWPVKIDPSQLDQILANLTANARDAMEGPGRLTIETANVTVDEAYCARNAGFVPGDFVVLAVSDTGKGMDRETLSHLFEPFFTTKKPGEGTGLGLATVYGIVKQNEGLVHVYSEPGKGTTFRIYFPRAAGEVAPSAPAAGQGPSGGTETLLIVEEEGAVLEMGKKILEGLGYRVFTARTPAEAIELARQGGISVDLLITDVIMPSMNGRELAERLGALHPGLKCLYMSGYTSNVIAHQGVLQEGVHFLAKPFSGKTLAQKVREVLDAKP